MLLMADQWLHVCEIAHLEVTRLQLVQILGRLMQESQADWKTAQHMLEHVRDCLPYVMQHLDAPVLIIEDVPCS